MASSSSVAPYRKFLPIFGFNSAVTVTLFMSSVSGSLKKFHSHFFIISLLILSDVWCRTAYREFIRAFSLVAPSNEDCNQRNTPALTLIRVSCWRKTNKCERKKVFFFFFRASVWFVCSGLLQQHSGATWRNRWKTTGSLCSKVTKTQQHDLTFRWLYTNGKHN